MNSEEEAFQAALDANPDDHTTRRVFGDWLQERGDPRAEGYRALGVNGYRPWRFTTSKRWGWFEVGWADVYGVPPEDGNATAVASLPHDWCGWDSPDDGRNSRGRLTDDYPLNGDSWGDRREAEDAAALAFSQLPPGRRAELLNREAVPSE
jgi:uncharacterized protein (TIGR02996 family)